jgi:uncharacterized protein (TIGR02996 family)
MTDHDAFLAALETNPGDDLAWLVYADWLEEQGEALADVLRKAIRTRRWELCQRRLFRALDRRRRRLLACDCLERVLPIFERRYPDDSRPRQLVETMRTYATGKRVAAAKAALRDAARAAGIVEADSDQDPDQFSAAGYVAMIVNSTFTLNLAHAYTQAGYAIVIDRFGSAAVVDLINHEIQGKSPHDDPPESLVAKDAESRWQVARMLRYRFGCLGGDASS